MNVGLALHVGCLLIVLFWAAVSLSAPLKPLEAASVGAGALALFLGARRCP